MSADTITRSNILKHFLYNMVFSRYNFRPSSCQRQPSIYACS